MSWLLFDLYPNLAKTSCRRFANPPTWQNWKAKKLGGNVNYFSFHFINTKLCNVCKKWQMKMCPIDSTFWFSFLQKGIIMVLSSYYDFLGIKLLTFLSKEPRRYPKHNVFFSGFWWEPTRFYSKEKKYFSDLFFGTSIY